MVLVPSICVYIAFSSHGNPILPTLLECIFFSLFNLVAEGALVQPGKSAHSHTLPTSLDVEYLL